MIISVKVERIYAPYCIELSKEHMEIFSNDAEIVSFLEGIYRGYKCFSDWGITAAEVKPFPENALKLKLDGIRFTFTAGISLMPLYVNILFLRDGFRQGVMIAVENKVSGK